MQIIDYIKSLLPKFGKDRVLEDSRIIRTEIETVSLPSYVEAEKVFTGWKFKSKQMTELITIFNRNIKTGSGFGTKDNIVTNIRKGLERILDIQELVEDKLQKNLEHDVFADGVTCLKANLIQCLEGISFISKYSYKLLNYIYVVETAIYTNEENWKGDFKDFDAKTYIESNFSPAEIEYIEKSFTQFCLVLGALTKTKQDFNKLIEEIPDISINATNSDAINSTISPDKLDPLGMRGFSSTSNSVFMNPIYHFGLMVAEWQANRYKVAKETKKVLELRLLNLQLKVQNNPDAKLEQEIAYIQSRIQGLDYKIQKMEESVK